MVTCNAVEDFSLTIVLNNVRHFFHIKDETFSIRMKGQALKVNSGFLITFVTLPPKEKRNHIC